MTPSAGTPTPAATASIINGDNVTATGLFVEHFQQYNTVWNGENGTTILYQNELPYDPPTQADWMNGSVEGWAGYKVGDHVRTHNLYGGGVYVFNQNNPSIHTENGFEVPETPGRPAAPHHDGQPQRRHDRPRRQRRGRPGRHDQDRRPGLCRRVPVMPA